MEAVGQKVLDFVLTMVKFRASVHNLPLNRNFHFDSCARPALEQWHTSAKVTGVEVPVLICQVFLCGNNGCVYANHSEWYQAGFYTLFLLIFVWKIYLVQSLEEDCFFSMCKLCLVWFSLLLLSISNTETDLHSHVPLKQARLWSRASPGGTTHGSALL